MKADKPERRPPFQLPTHKSHRGKRDAKRLIAGRNESESLLDVSLDECALFFAAQAVVKKTFSHPLDRLPSMGGEDEHAIRRQVVGKKAQEIRPLLTIQVREQRPARRVGSETFAIRIEQIAAPIFLDSHSHASRL
jgi:hypothetical protein